MYERIAPLAYDSLDDIPEPAESLTLVGHEEARLHLQAAYDSGKLHHAVLLSGPRGIGKSTLAFHFAAGLLGEAFQDGARNAESTLYRQIASGSHPGLLYLSRPYDEKGKKFRTAITADEIRKVTRFLSLRTHDGGYRVVIIDSADDMNRSAANALLKTLEEPPEKVLFLLISHSSGNLLPTIRSRTQSIKLHPLGSSELLTVLSEFHVSLPDTESKRADLIQKAAGSVRSALLLTLHGGLEIADTMDGLIAGRGHHVSEAYRLADALSGRDAGIQFELFNQYSLERLSDAAAELARKGQRREASRLADAWHHASKRIQETETFNLDKKQHVLNLLSLMKKELSVAAA